MYCLSLAGSPLAERSEGSPCCCVSYLTADSPEPVSTAVIANTDCPVWDDQRECRWAYIEDSTERDSSLQTYIYIFFYLQCFKNVCHGSQWLPSSRDFLCRDICSNCLEQTLDAPSLVVLKVLKNVSENSTVSNENSCFLMSRIS